MNADDPLSALLRSSDAEPSRPDNDFREAVWQRIRKTEHTGTSPTLLRWALPIAASVAVTAGAAAGIVQSRVQTTQQLAAAYARSIDPLLMTAHVDHSDGR